MFKPTIVKPTKNKPPVEDSQHEALASTTVSVVDRRFQSDEELKDPEDMLQLYKDSLDENGREHFKLMESFIKHRLEYCKLDADLMAVTNALANMVHDLGYTITIILKDKFAKDYMLSSSRIDLKIGNNGGFWFTQDRTGSYFLSAMLSFNGKREELVIPFFEMIEMSIVSGEISLITLNELVAEHYYNILEDAHKGSNSATVKSSVPTPDNAPAVKAKAKGSVISLFPQPSN